MAFVVEVSRHFCLLYIIGDVVEVGLEPLFQAVLGLSHILFATTFVGDAVDDVDAIACHIGLGILLPARGLSPYFTTFF